MPRKQYTLSDRVFEPKRDCTIYVEARNGRAACSGLKYLVCAVDGECSFYKKRGKEQSNAYRKNE